MDRRNIIIAALDVSLALLVLFVIAFLATSYDESAGPHRELAILDVPHALPGTYTGLHFIGVYITDRRVEIREYQNGAWSEGRVITGIDWNLTVRRILGSSELPILVYEQGQSPLFGDVVREAVSLGRPVAVARAPAQ